MKRRRAGRPELPKDERRTITKRFMCNAEEAQMLEQAAEAEGLPFSEWLRELGLKRAKKILK